MLSKRADTASVSRSQCVRLCLEKALKRLALNISPEIISLIVEYVSNNIQWRFLRNDPDSDDGDDGEDDDATFTELKGERVLSGLLPNVREGGAMFYSQQGMRPEPEVAQHFSIEMKVLQCDGSITFRLYWQRNCKSDGRQYIEQKNRI